MQTKPLNERQQDVAQALNGLRHMRGFPETPESIEMVCRVIALFCQTVEVFHGSHDPEYSDPSDLGNVVPLDWLVTEIASRCTWFPAPIEIRAIYEEKFTPLDGRSVVSLNSASLNSASLNSPGGSGGASGRATGE